jgi:hypothetical protein
MKLSDLRKLTVKKNLHIRFALSNGMECLLDEHGVARVPALHAAPSFSLEEELAAAREFLVEPAAADQKHKARPKPRRCTRDEMTVLATAAPGAEPAHEDHDD